MTHDADDLKIPDIDLAGQWRVMLPHSNDQFIMELDYESSPMTHDPEYCKRVAEACGLTAEIDMGGRYCYVWEQDPFDGIFRPDEDWNHAMWAAERAGLWTNRVLHCDYREDGRRYWAVFDRQGKCHVALIDGGYESGPRVICEAILKLKEAASA